MTAHHVHVLLLLLLLLLLAPGIGVAAQARRVLLRCLTTSAGWWGRPTCCTPAASESRCWRHSLWQNSCHYPVRRSALCRTHTHHTVTQTSYSASHPPPTHPPTTSTTTSTHNRLITEVPGDSHSPARRDLHCAKPAPQHPVAACPPPSPKCTHCPRVSLNADTRRQSLSC
jgi:hypothetical protein